LKRNEEVDDKERRTMKIDNKEILDNILEALKSDPKLSSYVKRISHGDMSVSRKIFPFIDVGNFHIRQDKATTGSVVLTYMIEIIAGTKSLAPGVAREGAECGGVGIVELCDDICDALRGRRVNMCSSPSYLTKSNPDILSDKGETIHIGQVTIIAKLLAAL